jgi:tetratricopeptide (TPR) repeat protein
MRLGRKTVWLVAGLILWPCAGVSMVRGLQKSQPPPPAPAEPAFDPLRAEKDIEVGQYHLRRGHLDAAIDRFRDATEARPNFALAYHLLAEAQEKKGLKAEAIASYESYLKILPHAEDAEKVRARIGKLKHEMARDKTTTPSH